MKLLHIAAATVMASGSFTAVAGDFLELNKAFPLRLTGANNQNSDRYYLEATQIQVTRNFRH
jgi:hypothetical protein